MCELAPAPPAFGNVRLSGGFFCAFAHILVACRAGFHYNLQFIHNLSGMQI
jgi:hypothetical protein